MLTAPAAAARMRISISSTFGITNSQRTTLFLRLLAKIKSYSTAAGQVRPGSFLSQVCRLATDSTPSVTTSLFSFRKALYPAPTDPTQEKHDGTVRFATVYQS
jgi:hypothetical protein